MTVEADGVFYSNVISITEIAPNKPVLVISDSSTSEASDADKFAGKSANRTVTVPIFCPIQICGGMSEAGNRTVAIAEKKDEKPVFHKVRDWLKTLKAFILKAFMKIFPKHQNQA